MIENVTHALQPEVAESVRLTTLCFIRLCIGYRSTLRPSGTNVTSTPTDVISASIVISTTFLLVSIVAILALLILETMRHSTEANSLHAIQTQAASRSSTAPDILALFDHLNAHAGIRAAGACKSVCTICLEDLVPTSVMRRLPCSHVFHTECIDRWLLQSMLSDVPACREAERTGVRPVRCPVCNASVYGHGKTDCQTAGRDISIHIQDVHIV